MCSAIVETSFRDRSYNWGEPDSGISNIGQEVRQSSLFTVEAINDNDLTFNKLLVLSDEFEQLDPDTNTTVHSLLQVYLTDTELIVATKESSEIIKHLRTHQLRDTLFERDRSNMDVLRVITDKGETYHYKSKRSHSTEIGLWITRIFQSKRCSDSPSSSTDSTVTAENRSLQVSTPTLTVQRPSREWHGESLLQYRNDHSTVFFPDPLPDDDLKYSSLKRRGAFRIQDLRKSKTNNRTMLRSSSVPPDDNKDTATSTPNGVLTSTPRTFHNEASRSSAPSSLRKKRLKFSRKSFTKALSARLTNANVVTPKSAQSSPNFTKKEFKRGHSFHSSHSSTLPRLSRPTKSTSSSKPVQKNKHRSESCSASTPEPITPSKLKSPGALLRIFHRKWNWSDVWTSPSEDDHIDVGSLEDPFTSKPITQKLYLQNLKEIATELTLMDAEMFRSISLSELFNEAWTKKTKHTTSPNVLKMIESFNHLARVVCTEIVQEKTVQSRAKAIASYIQLADHCYRLCNYNSMKAIISGLQSQPVYRLTKSWNHVPSRRRKKYEKLSNLLYDPNNTEPLRQEMFKNLQKKSHCVPYLGWLLTNILHSQTYSQMRNGTNHHKRSASMVERIKRKSWRDSILSVSLPSSPTDPNDTRNNMIPIFGSHDETSFLAAIKSTISKSIDIPLSPTHNQSSPIKLQIPHPVSGTVFFGMTPNTSVETDCYSAHHESSSDTSNDENHTDSAIGLDSSITSTSPGRTKGNKTTNEFLTKSLGAESFEEYALPIVCNNFDSDDDDITYSSTTSLISPSIVTLSLIEKRRLTLPCIFDVTPTRKVQCSHTYYDSQYGGVLFSCCPAKSEDDWLLPSGSDDIEDPTQELVAQNLMQSCGEISSNEILKVENEMKISSEDNFLTLDNSGVVKVEQDIITSSENDSQMKEESVFDIFEQYQINTLQYLTESVSQSIVRTLIVELPCLDENECHSLSLKVEPNNVK